MAKVILFGVGRGAETAYNYLNYDSDHEVVAFAVHSEYRQVDTFLDKPVVDFETLTETHPPSDFQLFASLGYEDLNRVRQKIFDEGKSMGYTFISYVHSSNHIMEEGNIGENCLILENQSINFGAKIGNNVVLWSGNQVGDRTVIEDHVWVSSHVCIAGNVVIGANSILGINAAISNDITVGEKNYIGANTLIAKNTGPGEVFVVEGTKKFPIPSEKFIRVLKKPQ